MIKCWPRGRRSSLSIITFHRLRLLSYHKNLSDYSAVDLQFDLAPLLTFASVSPERIGIHHGGGTAKAARAAHGRYVDLFQAYTRLYRNQ